MMPSVFDKRPPFVRFEEREYGINPEASAAAGRPVPRVVAMACITPHGSKDVVEKVATEWLEQIKKQALAGTYPTEWLNHFTLAFSEWQKGNELPREGTPIRTWPAINREQISRVIAVGLTTVEDLAEVPDSGLAMMGLDGRYLRDLARNWINEAKDKGINARKLADAEVTISDLRETIDRLTGRLAALEAKDEKRGKRDAA